MDNERKTWKGSAKFGIPSERTTDSSFINPKDIKMLTPEELKGKIVKIIVTESEGLTLIAGQEISTGNVCIFSCASTKSYEGAKYFKFTKDYCVNGRIGYHKGTELRIMNKKGIDVVMDGCFTVLQLDKATDYGEVVVRPY